MSPPPWADGAVGTIEIIMVGNSYLIESSTPVIADIPPVAISKTLPAMSIARPDNAVRTTHIEDAALIPISTHLLPIPTVADDPSVNA